ncbi:MAG: hypothetical protein ACLPIC_16910 [Rhodoblastus sp.]|uniref:hypothetical protein n=1 Tax=Rhodoblastus sp. TaxID=1962975 RepID=UPI003F9CBA75
MTNSPSKTEEALKKISDRLLAVEARVESINNAIRLQASRTHGELSEIRKAIDDLKDRLDHNQTSGEE